MIQLLSNSFHYYFWGGDANFSIPVYFVEITRLSTAATSFLSMGNTFSISYNSLEKHRTNKMVQGISGTVKKY
jgi:hypothetical protein